MAKTIKLPADLRDWKVTSFVGEDNGCEVYKVSRKIDKNTAQNAILRHAFVGKSNYTDEHAEYFTEEADFIESVKDLDGISNYLDVYVQDNQNKKTCDLYIFTEELTSLEELMKTKTFAEDEVVDFGIQMSEMLETLEAKNIFHGNISPKNIFVTADGRYKIGGFTDFEGKITDTSFVAPEVYKQENVDYTTDIYSVGIIMYAMCNGGKIPFESDSCDRKNACEERFSGKAVTAPSEGDEKLKSVIVIACQPNNTNRWKNAGNIKNALTSIKAEIGTSSPVPNPDVVVPENTDFDGNVFEEYDYDEFEDTEPTEPQDNFDDKDEVQTVEDAVLDNEFKGGEQLGIAEVLAGEESLPVDGNAPVDSDEVSGSDTDESGGFEVVDVTDAVDEPENSEVKTDEVSEEKQPEFEDISSVSSEDDKKEQTVTDKKAEEFEDVSSNSEVAPEVLPPVTSVEVFDDYSGADHKNVLTSNESSKDYGDFFEDEPSVKRTDNKADDTKKIEEKNDFDDNSFEDDNNEFGYADEEDNKENVKKKKNKFIIILCAVVIAAMYWYFGTEQGSTIRSTGSNPAMSKAQGININFTKVIALALSNGLVALSGSLFAQYQGFADINMGRGAIVIGLAAVIIGEVLGEAIFRKHMNFIIRMVFVIVGGILYYIAMGIVLWLKMPTDDTKLFTAIIVAIFLAVPYLQKKRKTSFKKVAKMNAKNAQKEG